MKVQNTAFRRLNQLLNHNKDFLICIIDIQYDALARMETFT